MIFSRPCVITFHGKRKDLSEVRAQTDRLKTIISAEQTHRDEIVGLAMERTPLWRAASGFPRNCLRSLTG